MRPVKERPGGKGEGGRGRGGIKIRNCLMICPIRKKTINKIK